MKRILFLCLSLLALASGVRALEITRYVAPEGTGDGLTKENPTGDLKKVLDLSKDVDALTVYLEPGTYALPPLKNVNSRPQYRNVAIYGGGCAEVRDVENKSVITGDLFINGGAVLNVDFRGSVYEDKWSPNTIHGTLHVIGCNVFFTRATALEAEAVPGQILYLIDTYSQSVSVTNFQSGPGKADVAVWGCNFCDGDGAVFSNVRVTAVGSSFSNNKNSPGLTLNRCEGSALIDCKIMRNTGQGGVAITDLTDRIDVTFDRCVISGNVTTDAYFCAAVTAHCPIMMKSCLIAGNREDVKGLTYSENFRGAIMLDHNKSKFMNCTFYNNSAVFNYSMEETDHRALEGAQIWNSVFLKNAKPYWTKRGLKPEMSYCAADFGSDIPELDAERKMTRITAENAGMIVTANASVHLEPGSPLINAGLPDYNLDLNGNSHQLLGATDLGCAEFTGEWEKTEPEILLALDGGKYARMKTRYQGTDYYAYAPLSLIKDGKAAELSASLYCGNELRPLKKEADDAATACFRGFNANMAVLYNFRCSPWGTDGIWTVKQVESYTSAPPQAERVNDEWVLKQAKAASATTQKRTTGKTPARKTAPRKSTGRR